MHEWTETALPRYIALREEFNRKEDARLFKPYGRSVLGRDFADETVWYSLCFGRVRKTSRSKRREDGRSWKFNSRGRLVVDNGEDELGDDEDDDDDEDDEGEDEEGAGGEQVDVDNDSFVDPPRRSGHAYGVDEIDYSSFEAEKMGPEWDEQLRCYERFVEAEKEVKETRGLVERWTCDWFVGFEDLVGGG